MKILSTLLALAFSSMGRKNSCISVFDRVIKGLAGVICFCTAISMSFSIHADDYLSIKFSPKNQLKTGMTWIQFKPELVLASKLRKSSKKQKDAIQPVPGDVLNGRLPYSAVGKLFFTKDNGKVSNCSAAFAGGGDVIVTAAHCVMTSDGDWNADFLFVRAYGSDKQDVYAIQCVAVPSRWGEMNGNDLLPYDYAFLRTTRKSIVGSLGITNGAPPQELTIVGYSDTHYEGRQLVSLPTEVVFTNAGQLGFIDNPFGEGNSGAPWLGLSTIYSISSHYRADKENIMWGPRLTADTIGLIEYTRNGCEST